MAVVTRRRPPFSALLLAAVCVVAIGCADQLRLKNDLPQEVRLSGCKRELKFLPAGAEISYKPLSPCFVRDAASLHELGCLRFPPEAFAEGSMIVVLVSSMEHGISEEECVNMESY